MTSAAVAFSLVLSNWFLVMGIQVRGDEQAVITSIGGTHLESPFLLGSLP